MGDGEARARLRETQGVTVDAAEAEAALAVAQTVGAAVDAAAARLMTLDEAPWSFDTLRAMTIAGESR